MSATTDSCCYLCGYHKTNKLTDTSGRISKKSKKYQMKRRKSKKAKKSSHGRTKVRSQDKLTGKIKTDIQHKANEKLERQKKASGNGETAEDAAGKEVGKKTESESRDHHLQYNSKFLTHLFNAEPGFLKPMDLFGDENVQFQRDDVDLMLFALVEKGHKIPEIMRSFLVAGNNSVFHRRDVSKGAKIFDALDTLGICPFNYLKGRAIQSTLNSNYNAAVTKDLLEQESEDSEEKEKEEKGRGEQKGKKEEKREKKSGRSNDNKDNEEQKEEKPEEGRGKILLKHVRDLIDKKKWRHVFCKDVESIGNLKNNNEVDEHIPTAEPLSAYFKIKCTRRELRKHGRVKNMVLVEGNIEF